MTDPVPGAVIRALYGVPPEDFVPARAQAVADARKAGDRSLATTIGKLRKPTVAAWLVNLLAHQRPDLVAELLALGEEMRRAQRQLQGAQLRELSQRRRQVVAGLAREARTLAVQAGRGARDPLPLAEVEATLTAALADEAVADDVRAGRLAKAVEYAGFGELPRPQLRLVQGGEPTGEAAAEPVEEPAPARSPAEAGEPAKPAESAESAKRASTTGPAKRRPDETDSAAERRAAGERAEAQRAAAERVEAERVEAERAAAERAEAERLRVARAVQERAEAARRRTARAAAHRELLAARTELAEAEAVRTEAERAVRAAKRRVEKATTTVADLDRDGT